MGHRHRGKHILKYTKKYLPVAVGFLGVGILLVVILPVWVWLLIVSLVLIVTAFKLVYK